MNKLYTLVLISLTTFNLFGSRIWITQETKEHFVSYKRVYQYYGNINYLDKYVEKHRHHDLHTNETFWKYYYTTTGNVNYDGRFNGWDYAKKTFDDLEYEFSRLQYTIESTEDKITKSNQK